MKHWRFDGLLTQTGTWLEPAYVSVDASDKICAISQQAPHATNTDVVNCPGWALPGFPNAHSHVFQYAMAGCAEFLPRQQQHDDFWTWREAMYHVAVNVTPEQLQSIATMAYSEMLRQGTTTVTEFHYLHHDQHGQRYNNPTELAERLMAAAQLTGIQLTLVPVFYKNGNFDKPAYPKQRRFLFKDAEDYFNFVRATRDAAKKYPGVTVGTGVHSLRAAGQAEARDILNQRDAGTPVHIHAAEQELEVSQCLDAWGKRPIQWLLDNVQLGRELNIVHATHMDAQEIAGLARADVTAVLCPSTEGNLGDGVFPLLSYSEQGGRWCIGTDSHIGLNFAEELRWLDYAQRLHSRKRNPLVRQGGENSAWILFKEAVTRGRAANGIYQDDWFAVGERFAAVVVDATAPIVTGRSHEHRLASIIYSGDASLFLGTIIGDEWIVEAQHHRRHQEIRQSYQKTMQKIILPTP